MKKKTVTLYNMIFPVWLLWLIPVTWIVVLPANFLLDLLVLMLTLKSLRVEDRKACAKAVIFKVWIFGFIADFIGTVAMFLSSLISFDYQTPFGRWWFDKITNAVAYDPFSSIAALAWIALSIALTAGCIYYFNCKICLKGLALPLWQKKKIALSLAIFTAPYLFYLPTSWFF